MFSRCFEAKGKRILVKDKGNDLVAIVRSGWMEVHNASWIMRERRGGTCDSISKHAREDVNQTSKRVGDRAMAAPVRTTGTPRKSLLTVILTDGVSIQEATDLRAAIVAQERPEPPCLEYPRDSCILSMFLRFSGCGRGVSASKRACIGCARSTEVGCMQDSAEGGGDLERTETLFVRSSKISSK